MQQDKIKRVVHNLYIARRRFEIKLGTIKIHRFFHSIIFTGEISYSKNYTRWNFKRHEMKRKYKYIFDCFYVTDKTMHTLTFNEIIKVNSSLLYINNKNLK